MFFVKLTVQGGIWYQITYLIIGLLNMEFSNELVEGTDSEIEAQVLGVNFQAGTSINNCSNRSLHIIILQPKEIQEQLKLLRNLSPPLSFLFSAHNHILS